IAGWSRQVRLGVVVGILWFDWLFGAAAAGPLDVHATILTPLAASAALMASVAVYQLFVDVRFLNHTVYGEIARASGTVFDANVCGTIAGLWVGGVLLWAAARRGRKSWLMASGVSLACLAVWATGSRTVFAAAVITSGFAATAFLFDRPHLASRRAMPAILTVATLAVGVVLLLTFV